MSNQTLIPLSVEAVQRLGIFALAHKFGTVVPDEDTSKPSLRLEVNTTPTMLAAATKARPFIKTTVSGLYFSSGVFSPLDIPNRDQERLLTAIRTEILKIAEGLNGVSDETETLVNSLEYVAGMTLRDVEK